MTEQGGDVIISTMHSTPGDGAELLSRPSKTQLEKMSDVNPYDVTPCFRVDLRLGQLLEAAGNVQNVMRIGR
jgi:hypothetical protein